MNTEYKRARCMTLSQSQFEKAWKEHYGKDEFLQKDEGFYTSEGTEQAFFWFEKGLDCYHEGLKESPEESFGSYWDAILARRNDKIQRQAALLQRCKEVLYRFDVSVLTPISRQMYSDVCVELESL